MKSYKIAVYRQKNAWQYAHVNKAFVFNDPLGDIKLKVLCIFNYVLIEF